MELTNKAFSIEENILFDFLNQVYPITEEEFEPDLIDVIDIIKKLDIFMDISNVVV